MFVLARNFRDRGAHGWARGSWVCGVALAIGFAVILVAFNTEGPIADVAGLVQRLWVAVGFGWLSLIALYLLGVAPNIRKLPD
jgi:hypothetical protein